MFIYPVLFLVLYSIYKLPALFQSKVLYIISTLTVPSRSITSQQQVVHCSIHALVEMVRSPFLCHDSWGSKFQWCPWMVEPIRVHVSNMWSMSHHYGAYHLLLFASSSFIYQVESGLVKIRHQVLEWTGVDYMSPLIAWVDSVSPSADYASLIDWVWLLKFKVICIGSGMVGKSLYLVNTSDFAFWCHFRSRFLDRHDRWLS